VGAGRKVVLRVVLFLSFLDLPYETCLLQMNSAPAEIQGFLKYHWLDRMEKMIWSAVMDNRVDVLEWLHKHTPGGVTAEDCRAYDNCALQWAAHNGHVAVLDWMHKCIPGGVTAKDCRTNNNNALRLAASRGHMNVLEWLHQHIPGGVTAEDCRTENNYALQHAASNGHVGVLEWLHGHIPGGVAAEDCRAYDNYALRWAARNGHVGVLEWLATKLTLAEFAKCKCENVWWQVQLQVRRESMLALVVAGKRKKIRLPPELWELVWGLAEQWQ
jgi:hypothetical protein